MVREREQQMLQGKTAVVTGASGGLGAAICEELARQGARLVVLELGQERASHSATGLQAQGFDVALGVAVDVSSAASVLDAFDQIRECVGGIDILVNNAGIREIKSIESLPTEEWDRVIGVNLSGPFYCSKFATPLLKENGGGNIVNIASVAGMIGIRSRAAYCASKHGVIGLTKTIAFDLAKHNIRVNAIAPGAIQTPMTEAYYKDEIFLEDLNHSVAQGNSGTPQAIADAVAFLCSPQASFINGAVLPVDGGFIAEKSFTTN